MTLTCNEACAIIGKHRGTALIVSTMSAMFGITMTSPSPLNLSSVPLMGGAGGLGLGLAIAQPERNVLILDGDASLLMELGILATIASQAPKNLVHFVFNNNAQFGGVANLPRPGGDFLDFAGIAETSGYRSSMKIATSVALEARLPALLSGKGPVFVELMIEPPERFGRETPQPEIPDLQFQRMAAEARAMMLALSQPATAS